MLRGFYVIRDSALRMRERGQGNIVAIAYCASNAGLVA